MKNKAISTFTITSWDEKPIFICTDAVNITRCLVQNKYTGDLQGTGNVEYLMTYQNEKSASFIGMERIEGMLLGQKGSFVIQHVGTYTHGQADASSEIIIHSGSSDLAGIKGAGGYSAKSDQAQLVINWDIVQ